MYEYNGLTPQLEKLIYFRIAELDNYPVHLYAQHNSHVSNLHAVLEQVKTGEDAAYWCDWIKMTAHWCVYVHVLRALVDFLNRSTALKGQAYRSAQIVSWSLMYLCVAILFFALMQEEALSIEAVEIESLNSSLLYTLAQLAQFVNGSTGFVVALVLVGSYGLTEVLFLVLLLRQSRPDTDTNFTRQQKQ